jgi:hypothetical protein
MVVNSIVTVIKTTTTIMGPINSTITDITDIVVTTMEVNVIVKVATIREIINFTVADTISVIIIEEITVKTIVGVR